MASSSTKCVYTHLFSILLVLSIAILALCGAGVEGRKRTQKQADLDIASLYPPLSGVVLITNTNWNQVLQSDHMWVIQFYKTDCPACIRPARTLIACADKWRNLVKFGAVNLKDREALENLASVLPIKGVPFHALYIPQPGNKLGVLPLREVSSQKATNMVIREYMPSFVTRVLDDDFGGFLADDRPKVLLFSNKTSTAPLFRALSSQFRHDLVLGRATPEHAPALVKEFRVTTFPELFLLRYTSDLIYHEEHEPVRYQGSLSYRMLESFLYKVVVDFRKNHEVPTEPRPYRQLVLAQPKGKGTGKRRKKRVAKGSDGQRKSPKKLGVKERVERLRAQRLAKEERKRQRKEKKAKGTGVGKSKGKHTKKKNPKKKKKKKEKKLKEPRGKGKGKGKRKGKGKGKRKGKGKKSQGKQQRAAEDATCQAPKSTSSKGGKNKDFPQCGVDSKDEL